PTTAGTAHTFTVTARDAYGNAATGYAGAVHFTSTDGQAALPADYAFAAADAGSHTFTGTLNTAGTQSLTAQDTTTQAVAQPLTAQGATPMNGAESGITVTAAASVWHQASAADFGAGSFSGTALAGPAGGGVQLAPAFADA